METGAEAELSRKRCTAVARGIHRTVKKILATIAYNGQLTDASAEKYSKTGSTGANPNENRIVGRVSPCPGSLGVGYWYWARRSARTITCSSVRTRRMRSGGDGIKRRKKC